MASPDRSKRKILKAKKTMPISCRKQGEILNRSKSIDALKTTAITDTVPNGDHNLSTVLITSKCKHSENVDSSLGSNKNLVLSQKSIESSQNVKPVKKNVDLGTRLECINEQFMCPYQRSRKAIVSPSKLSVQETEDSQNTSETHCKYQATKTRSSCECEENSPKSTCYPPAALNGVVENTLDDERIAKVFSNLEANSNSESLYRRQSDTLNSDSCFVPVEKKPILVNSVSCNNCAATILKTEESSRTCHSSISLCKPADSECHSLLATGSSHNQKKRMFLESKENVKRLKTSEQINESICVVLERQTAVLEQVKHLIRQEMCSINYKLFDEKLNELRERIGKTQCRNKHEAIACELFVKVTRLHRRIKAVLSQRNCLESNTLSSNTAHKTGNSQATNLGKNQESVSGPNEKAASVNCEPFNPSEKARERIKLSSDSVEFVSESNDDVMLISVESPNLATPVTSDPTDTRKTTSGHSSSSSSAVIEVRAEEKRKLDFVIDLTREGLSNCSTESPAFTLESPSSDVLNSKEITPVAENGSEDFESLDHLPPLPEPPPPLSDLVDKIRDMLPPQKPELKVKRVLKPLGIALTWNITKINPKCAPVESYHLFLCHESPRNKLVWKKIGEIKALPLPMACTLSQFLTCNKYYFTVQSKDIFGRYGPFCDIKSISGFSENLT